ncbi:MAG: protein kinase domain-containing protein [Actinomycetota bacterium]
MKNEELVANRYKIIKKIASGGMADVYLGQDQKLDRKVAIKILSPNYAQDKSFVARFKREAQILAKLNHPSIVQIYDWGKYNGSYFICMEYVEGYSLKDIIERRGVIPPRAAARYCIQICEALEIAHRNNLIHRDIKPQNILITPEDKVKVTDFGIAKHSVEDATRTLNIIGTANYISPEQAMGKTIDNRSDIYSLGVVLYEMITADLPFRGESSIEISLKHINEAPVKPSLMIQGIPPALEKIVMHCLQKDSNLRYSSVSHLKEDLRKYLENKKLSIERPVRLKTGRRPFFTRPVLGPLNYLSILSMALAIIFMVSSLVLAVGYSNSVNTEEKVQIPPLTGSDYTSVEAILSMLDIDISISRQYDNTPEGTIISQDPAPGAELEVPVSIQLVVSRGPQTIPVTVPNLIGLTREEATQALEDAGLSVGRTEEKYSDYLDKGMVISQDPSYGQDVEEDTGINFTVSTGRQMIVIPNITGTDYFFAISHLQSLGLEVDSEMVTDYTLPPGTVTGTSPSPGTDIEAGSVVHILVSINQETIPVPDLAQQELQTAVNTLESNALNYEIREIEAAYSVQQGLVLSQFPEAGSNVFPNSTVIIFVGA